MQNASESDTPWKVNQKPHSPHNVLTHKRAMHSYVVRPSQKHHQIFSENLRTSMVMNINCPMISPRIQYSFGVLELASRRARESGNYVNKED